MLHDSLSSISRLNDLMNWIWWKFNRIVSIKSSRFTIQLNEWCSLYAVKSYVFICVCQSWVVIRQQRQYFLKWDYIRFVCRTYCAQRIEFPWTQRHNELMWFTFNVDCLYNIERTVNYTIVRWMYFSFCLNTFISSYFPNWGSLWIIASIQHNSIFFSQCFIIHIIECLLNITIRWLSIISWLFFFRKYQLQIAALSLLHFSFDFKRCCI